MPFVLFLIFGTWLLLICANDRGKHNAKASEYYKEYPEVKRAEEVILRLELYREYKQDLSRDDPIGDALEAAGWKIYNDGCRPLSVLRSGKSTWTNDPSSRRRDENNSKMNWKFPTIKSLGGSCPPELQERWVQLAEQCAEDLAAKEQRGPKMRALEYFLACYNYQCILEVRKAAREADCGIRCPADARLLANYFAWRRIIDLGHTPSSWKLFHPCTFEEFRSRFDPLWPPDKTAIESLLTEDRQTWFDVEPRSPSHNSQKTVTFQSYCDYIFREVEDTIAKGIGKAAVCNYVIDYRRWMPPNCSRAMDISPRRTHFIGDEWTDNLVAITANSFEGHVDVADRESFWRGVILAGNCCNLCRCEQERRYP